jgi:hypothetical protein
MRAAAPAYKNSLGVEIITNGRIDGSGAVRARELRRYCRYDFVWQKETK